jgi:hypothetical protein
VGIHDRFADLENHVLLAPFATLRIPRANGPQKWSDDLFAQVRGGERALGP